VAVGGDFHPNRLLLAYRSGIFPWSSHPITWWSPDPRSIIPLDSFHIPRRLERTLRQGRFTITFNRAFREVVTACAEPGPGREETWISSDFIEAYDRLHQLGHAHSVECWMEGELAGGVYGVAIGGFFAGESMFSRRTNGSKIALIHLLEHLRDRRFTLFDTQVATDHTRTFGALDLPRRTYLEQLRQALSVDAQF
jgi:leucyl/phenylalanyl-tRNA--protein transferase